MPDITSFDEQYDQPTLVAEGIYWVGFNDKRFGLRSNPYLIVEGDEAVVIDGGSRWDFPAVMMKILQAGISPSSIVALIYQNYNPRTCGSIPHFEDIVSHKDLKIISDQANHLFIQHYSESSILLSLREVDYRFRFSSGRTLQFVKTPFAYSAGSFVTFDERSGTLFSSELFSSYADEEGSVFARLKPECGECEGNAACQHDAGWCAIHNILSFHRAFMPSERALKDALDQIAAIPFTSIAPQHGCVIRKAEDIIHVCELLASLKGVGVDSITGDRSISELGNVSPIRERLSRHA